MTVFKHVSQTGFLCLSSFGLIFTPLYEPVLLLGKSNKQSNVLKVPKCSYFSGKSTYKWLTHSCLYILNSDKHYNTKNNYITKSSQGNIDKVLLEEYIYICLSQLNK